MKIIGTKNIARADLYEIIVGLDSIAIDNTLIEEFNKDTKDSKLGIMDLKTYLDTIQTKLPSIFSFTIEESELYFARAYAFFTLVLALKLRGQLRHKVAEFLVNEINAKKRLPGLLSRPQNLLLIFYGECGASAIIDSLSQLPSLTTKEKDVFLSVIEQAYFFAMSALQAFKIQNILGLNEVSFALNCEANAIKNDFLYVKYEKRSFNKFCNSTAGEVLNMLSGTKFSKTIPSNLTTTWIDIVAQVKQIQYDTISSIIEECAQEEVEALKEMKINSSSISGRNWHFFMVQSLNSLNALIALLLNIMERSKTQKSLGKDLLMKWDEISKEYYMFDTKTPLNMPFFSQKGLFGENYGHVFYINTIANLIHLSSTYEALGSIIALEDLNRSILEKEKSSKKPDQIKEIKEETKEGEKKSVKAVKKIQLGKGTTVLCSQVFDVILAKNLSLEGLVDEIKVEMNPYNKSFMTLIDDVCSSKNDERRKPKIPKGTRDFAPLQMSIRKKAFQTITSIFMRHGAVEIDTPVFELKETLTGKYGEESKLIYDLQDQGGELLSLRYDLTVPFARYLAMKNIQNIKRFHIAKVYRRDNPAMNKGRFREFYQCDFDIAGKYGTMIPDAEVLSVINEILTELDIGKFTIKVNNRKLLDAMVELSGAPKQKFKSICSSVDKLDKEPWDVVKRELIEEKGLTLDMANKLGEFVQLKGVPIELLTKLNTMGIFAASKVGVEALKEMEILFKYLEDMNCSKNILFDLSLARGLDYYTGMILEAVLEGANVGSISGGGRYDQLVGMFSSKDIPAVGASIGIERIFAILEEKYKNDPSIRCTETEVLVCSIGSGMVGHRFNILSSLWDNKIKAEQIYDEKPKPAKQLNYALENMIPFVIWIGEDEIKDNKFKIKCLYKSEEICVSKQNLIEELKKMIADYYIDLQSGKVVFKKPEPTKDDK